MKIGFLIFITFSFVFISDAQIVNGVDHYKTKHFDAAIFPKEIIVCSDTLLNRFTPTRSEIDSAEKVVRIKVGGSKAAEEKHPYINHGDSAFPRYSSTDTTVYTSEDLHRWFSEGIGYYKQYFGCIDRDGNKILLISCFINPGEFWLQEPLSQGEGWHDALDWRIKYNLNTGKLFDDYLGETFSTEQQPVKGVDHYKTKEINVAIFSKDVAKLDDTLVGRFSPTREEVYKTEMALRTKIKNSSVDSVWQEDKDYGVFSDLHIHRYDSDYSRQYFGYIDKSGDEILMINSFSWQGCENCYEYWLKEPITIEYEGSYAWNIKYNLNKCHFFDSIWGYSLIARNMNGVDHYKGDGFDDAIFPDTYKDFVYNGSKKYKTFTPKRNEIDLTEKAIKNVANEQKDLSLGVSFSNLINGGKFVKQYFGYIDDKNDSILYINTSCIYYHGTPSPYPWNWRSSWINNPQEVSDGGNCFWNIRFN